MVRHMSDTPAPPPIPKSASEVVGLWPTYRAMALDMDVPEYITRDMVIRNRIPARWDLRIVKAARARGFPVSLEILAEIRTSEQQGAA